MLISTIITTDEDPILRFEIFAIINLRGVNVSTKLYFNMFLVDFKQDT